MLKDILNFVAPKIGKQSQNSDDRLALVEMINQAAEEVHRSDDLAFCLFEQVFSATISEQQITLPYYVEFVRGVRRWDDRNKITLHSMRPRYQEFHNEYSDVTWRTKNDVPLAQSLDNESALTFTLDEAQDEEVKITIAGSTSIADKDSETVTIGVGELSAVTTKAWTNFPGIKSISKDRYTTSNVKITDADAVEVGVIPNMMSRTHYTTVQVEQGNEASNVCKTYEVLFKYRFIPFINDTDEFMYPHFDQAIGWRVLANYHGNGDDERSIQLAAAAQAKSMQLTKEASRDAFQAHELQYERRELEGYCAHKYIKHRGYARYRGY